MALPAVIDSTAAAFPTDRVGHLGPYWIGAWGYALYVNTSGTDKLTMAYSSNPDSVAFTLVDSDNVGTSILAIDSVIDANGDIHVACIDGNMDVFYALFDTSAKVWLDVDPTAGTQTIYQVFAPTTAPTQTQAWCSIGVRSDGDVLIAHCGEATKDMGQPVSDVSFSRLEGSTWTAAAVISDAGAKDTHFAYASIVVNDGDQAHFGHTQVGLSGSLDFYLTAISGSNTYRTRRTDSLQDYDEGICRGIKFTRSSTDKICFYGGNDTRMNAVTYTDFDDDTNPSLAIANLNFGHGAGTERFVGFGFDHTISTSAAQRRYVYREVSGDIAIRHDNDTTTYNGLWSASWDLNSGADIFDEAGTIDAFSGDFLRDFQNSDVLAIVYDEGGSIEWDQWVLVGPKTADYELREFRVYADDAHPDSNTALAAVDVAPEVEESVTIAVRCLFEDVAGDPDIGGTVNARIHRYRINGGSWIDNGLDEMPTSHANWPVIFSLTDEIGSFSSTIQRIGSGTYYGGRAVEVPAVMQTAVPPPDEEIEYVWYLEINSTWAAGANDGDDIELEIEFYHNFGDETAWTRVHDIYPKITYKAGAQAYTLAVDSAAFVLTGTAVNLEFGRVLKADSAAFLLNGTAVDLLRGYPLPVDSAAFNLTASAVDLDRGTKIKADSAAFNLAGTAVNLEYGRIFKAESASFLLTGTDVKLSFGYNMKVESAAFALSGTDVNLVPTRRLTVDSAAFNLTPIDVNLSRGLVLKAEAAGFSLSAQAASLKFGRVIKADSAAFNLTGTDAGLRRALQIKAESASFGLTGTDVLTRRGYPMPVDSAAFNLAGTAVDLHRGTKIKADSAAFNLAGSAVDLDRGTKIKADSAGFNLAGTDVELIYTAGYTLEAESAGFNLTGTAVDLLRGLAIKADSAGFNLAGSAVDLDRGAAIKAESAGFNLAGSAVDLDRGTKIKADSAGFNLAGTDVELIYTAGYTLEAESAGFNLTGTAVDLLRGLAIKADSAGFNLTGSAVDLDRGTKIKAESAGFNLTGTDVDLIYTAGFAIQAESAGFNLAGSAVDLDRGAAIKADSAGFNLAGTVVNLLRGLAIKAESAAFNLAGSAVDLDRGTKIKADSAAFNLAGTDVELIYTAGYMLAADSAAFNLAGSAVDLDRGTKIKADSAAFLWGATGVELKKGFNLRAESAPFILTASDSDLLRGFLIPADSANFTFTGSDVALEFGRLIQAESAAFNLAGTEVELIKSGAAAFAILAESAAFNLTGTDVALIVVTGVLAKLYFDAVFARQLTFEAEMQTAINQAATMQKSAAINAAFKGDFS